MEVTAGIIIALAALVHGTAGFGFPMIATPVLSMIFDVQTAILVLLLPTLTLNLANIFKGGLWGRSIGRYWPLAMWGILGSLAGTRLLLAVSPDIFRPVLAAGILVYLNAERLGVKFPWVKTRPYTAMACFGLAAGILGGTVNVMLPALVIFALEADMDKQAMIQIFNFCFFLGKLAQGSVFAVNGLFTVNLLAISLALAVLAVAASALGMRLRDRISARIFRIWLRRLLAAMAAVLLIQSFWG